jgi:Bacterial transcriptional activator domain
VRALHGSGRRAEALDAYAQVRAALRDELGLDPREGLQRVHRLVLSGSPPAPERSAAPPAGPRQLPSDIARFTGQRTALAALLPGSDPGGDSAGSHPIVVAVVSGPAGAGKPNPENQPTNFRLDRPGLIR